MIDKIRLIDSDGQTEWTLAKGNDKGKAHNGSELVELQILLWLISSAIIPQTEY